MQNLRPVCSETLAFEFKIQIRLECRTIKWKTASSILNLPCYVSDFFDIHCCDCVAFIRALITRIVRMMVHAIIKY